MVDRNGNVCEYDGYAIDPEKFVPSGKTREELKAEAEALRKKLLGQKQES